MLIADKAQNREDFLKHHRRHATFKWLDDTLRNILEYISYAINNLIYFSIKHPINC